eukprot:10310118-Heterocapsa_arctica.AAC.1
MDAGEVQRSQEGQSSEPMHLEDLVSPGAGASSSSSSGAAPWGIAGWDEYKQKDFFKSGLAKPPHKKPGNRVCS